jgi:hypothetical protein
MAYVFLLYASKPLATFVWIVFSICFLMQKQWTTTPPNGGFFGMGL